MAIIQGNAKQGSTRGFYPKVINGSLRFNDDDSAYLSWTPASAGNRKTWTWSGWVKLGTLGTNRTLLGGGASSSDRTYFGILADNQFRFVNTISGTSTSVEATLLLRDPSAWYHIVVACDTTQATAADRLSLYINGEEITAFDQTGYPAQNANTQISNNNIQALGSLSYSASNFWDGYMAEVFFLDGQSKAGSDFGETKNGVWVPKNITATDFTMGTNGFHLTFEDDTQVEAFNTVLYRGEGAVQQVTGVGFSPDLVWVKTRTDTNNHNLFDTVRGPSRRLFSNLTNAENTTANTFVSFDSDGFTTGVIADVNDANEKHVAWCWDAGANNAVTGHSSVTFEGTGSRQVVSGLPFKPDLLWFKDRDATRSHALVDSVRGRSKALFPDLTNAEGTSSGSEDLVSFEDGGFIVGTPARSGSFNASGQSIVAWAWDAGDSDPVSNTTGDTTATVKTNGDFSICAYSGTGAATSIGHGLSSAPNFVIVKDRSAAQNWVVWTDDIDTDGNQYLELNSTQGTQSSSVFWNSTAPDASKIYLGTSNSVSGRNFIAYAWRNVTGKQKFGSYTGTGATGNTVTTGFRVGWLMVKRTDTSGNSWAIWDASRNPFNTMDGALFPNSSGAEDVASTNYIDFTDTGFTIQNTSAFDNASGATYIYAAFAGSYSDYITDYNTDGTNTDSRVKASDATGFSIVNYIGNGNSSNSIGHGLSSTPDMIIIKNRDSGTTGWSVNHVGTGMTSGYLQLQSTAAFASAANNLVAVDSSTFSVGTDSWVNANGGNFIAYCWTETTGVSKFGGYSGSSSEVTINVGFNPAWVLIKNTSSAGFNWGIFDNTRNTDGTLENPIYPNTSGVEETGYSNPPVTFDGNNIKVRGGDNGFNNTGQTYIYAAFADTREAAFWLDQSGNDNDWQPVNLDHNDTVSDSPVDNFATMSPITVAQGQAQATLSNGNLKVDLGTPGSSVAHTYGTMAIPSSGQYYFEATFSDVSGGPRIGISVVRTTGNQSRYVYISSGQKIVGTSASSYGDSYAAGDTIGVAVDVDASTIEFYKNGTGQGSFSIDLTASTGGSASDYFPFITNGSGTSKSVVEFNFGQQPFKYGPPE